MNCVAADKRKTTNDDYTNANKKKMCIVRDEH